MNEHEKKLLGLKNALNGILPIGSRTDPAVQSAIKAASNATGLLRPNNNEQYQQLMVAVQASANTSKYAEAFAQIYQSANIAHHIDQKSIAARFNSSDAMAREICGKFGLYADASLSVPEWVDQLQQQMASVSQVWLNAKFPEFSIEGFAVLSRLGNAVTTSAPFDEGARELIDEDLGHPIDVALDATPLERDEAHLEAGLNPSILALEPSSTNAVLIETGFKFRAEFTPFTYDDIEEDPGLVFDPSHHAMITFVEHELRIFIDRQMRDQYGNNWIRTQLSREQATELDRKREQAISQGEEPLPLICYSNFMDLKDIVINRRHWREVFQSVFRHKAHFETSMERLYPIRNPLAHSRPIGRAQQLLLYAESTHITKAIGKNLFI